MNLECPFVRTKMESERANAFSTKISVEPGTNTFNDPIAVSLNYNTKIDDSDDYFTNPSDPEEIFREQSPRPRKSAVPIFGPDVRGRTADREEAAAHSRNNNRFRFGGSHRRAPSPVNLQSTDTQLRDTQVNVWHFVPLGSDIGTLAPIHDTARGRDRSTSTVDDGSRSGRQIRDRRYADQGHVRRPNNVTSRENSRPTLTVESRTGHRIRDRTYVGEDSVRSNATFAERLRGTPHRR